VASGVGGWVVFMGGGGGPRIWGIWRIGRGGGEAANCANFANWEGEGRGRELREFYELGGGGEAANCASFTNWEGEKERFGRDVGEATGCGDSVTHNRVHVEQLHR